MCFIYFKIFTFKIYFYKKNIITRAVLMSLAVVIWTVTLTSTNPIT